MPITPDKKNWTWVLERRCPECGFEAGAFDHATVADAIREQAALWPALLAEPTARRRPSDAQWSALEYGCHVRDVFRLYDDRLRLMLETEGPSYPDWDQDATAIADRYGRQDPATVSRELLDAAEALAARFDGVTGEQWERTGFRSDGAAFTVASFARYFIHDPIHHVHDVLRGNRLVDG